MQFRNNKKAGVLIMSALLAACVNEAAPPHPQSQPQLHEQLLGKSVTDLSHDLESGATTSEALVTAYLARIDALDRRGPALRSVIAVNPDAQEQARALDRERKERGSRGPLHGMPVLIKDNIETSDRMPTTVGSRALKANITGRDAPIVANLRAAGAVILGKTNLSEWANFRSDDSISGWSAVGGLTKNPHVLDRSACGSSAGSAVAVAAGLAPISVGTETDGSIVCPAAMNGIVGLKPTLGLLSSRHIAPIAHSQDTAGPMGASVRDVALLLDAMVGEAPACEPPAEGCRRADYAGALSADALKGKRLGVLRFKEPRQPQIAPVYEQALASLRLLGAVLVEVETPDMSSIHAAESIVLHVEFKHDLNAYLATLPEAVKIRSLNALIEFNRTDARELHFFGQDVFIKAEGSPDLNDSGYREALATSRRLAGAEGLGRLLSASKLDLLVAPTTGTAWRIDYVNGDQYPGSFSTLPAVSGYPHLTVPMGAVRALPLAISFIGAPWSEAELLAAGFAFEQAANVRLTAAFRLSLESEGAAGVRGR